uniref:tyrosine-type recombinase/integrase n=1 Tax=uncultured Dysgonomonas sp. TaxID=206096 RepID=UPI0026227795
KLAEAKSAIDKIDLFSKERFEDYFLNKAGTTDLRECFELRINQLKENNQPGTASIYDLAIKSFESVSKGMQLRDITPNFLMRYEREKVGKNELSVTTAAIYLRALRAIINIAIDEGKLSEDHYPFTTVKKKNNRYSIPTPDQRKHSNNVLSQEQLEKLVSATFKGRGKKRAVDMLEFIYGCGGANMTDILSLTKDNIIAVYHGGKKHEVLEFRRQKIRKTNRQGKVIQHLYTDKMKSIVAKYHKEGSEFLFPVLDGTEIPEKKKEKITTFIKRINTMIKKAAKDLNFPNWEHITTYSARHAFATHLVFEENLSTAIVANALGHESERTTEEYIGRLDFSMLQKVANAAKIGRSFSNAGDWAGDDEL